MKRYLVIILLSTWVAFVSGTAKAATRTIQFVGVNINHTSKILPSDYKDFIACSVLIMNTGATNQVVNSITFNTFDTTNDQLTTGIVPTVDALYQPNDASSAPNCPVSVSGPCTGKTIPPNGFYVGIAYMNPAALAGKLISLCSGQIQVADVSAAAPGSVVAVGSISYVSEMMFTGGQFSGALYVSGSHVPSGLLAANTTLAFDDVFLNSANTNYTINSSLPFAGSWKGAGQMNLFCAEACMRDAGVAAEGTVADFCRTACGLPSTAGVATMPEGNSMDGGSTFRTNLGYLEESLNPTVAGNTISTNPHHYNVFGAGLADNIRSLQRTANPHWAGGMVQEMIVGPFGSICSGNSGYFQAYNTDFVHSDSVGADIIAADSTNRYPPERLFCSHTHNQDSPYGYVTSTSQFTINGGNAF